MSSIIDTNRKALSTPVLFLVFNRLNTTKEVFSSIRAAKPPRLYIASDGARDHVSGEGSKVFEIREYVMNHIDWDCEVRTLFRDENLGCKVAVSSAIDWFFKNEEMGIILEDDCLPSQSFFWYCEELLMKYKDDQRIWHISGDNFQGGVRYYDGDYYYSQLPHIWGWATWCDRWAKYDVDMSDLPKFIEQKQIKNVFTNKQIQQKYLRAFKKVFDGDIDTWDYQWQYAMYKNGGLAILPNVNFISNIGFGVEATHTKLSNSFVEGLASSECRLPLVSPVFMQACMPADSLFYSNSKQSFVGKVGAIIQYYLNKILIYGQKN